MDDQKAENLLNLALDTPESERARTNDLNIGYDAAQRTWEIIVKYAGELGKALEESFPEVKLRELLNGFAILTIPENQVNDVIALPQIQYAEKPKRLFFEINQAKSASCLTQVQSGPEGLTGRGVLVAVIDSGDGVGGMPKRNARYFFTKPYFQAENTDIYYGIPAGIIANLRQRRAFLTNKVYVTGKEIFYGSKWNFIRLQLQL